MHDTQSAEIESGFITADRLLTAGYREFAPNPTLDKYVRRMFQRAFDDEKGRRFFVTFREWDHQMGHGLSYEAQLAFETNTAGYAWVTLKEPSIEATHARAEAVWNACGGCYYEIDP